jgi:hypothetical protein
MPGRSLKFHHLSKHSKLGNKPELLANGAAEAIERLIFMVAFLELASSGSN